MENEITQQESKRPLTGDFIKSHIDTLVIVSAIATSLIWMNGKFNAIEQDLAVMKAVLIMKNIMPCELAKKEPSPKAQQG